ncbi:MAG: methyl-accepting chemotaxis protein [Candidatus Omnitrophica bacterium]|nr:methyl-accepting chemotaxis protein [Candidatus Omnitrophota bacterium]MBU4488124.1 methyl-accepting chemotaxis protein [Candidatus Omnitrophota bacterium]MCG2704958.1 methyl-accepting chemotaxis protein [Candidatus Omnitrophota bacterium]
MEGRIVRTRYFLARGFQLRYAGIILLVAFVTAILSGFTVFRTTCDILGEKLSQVYPQGLFTAIFNKVAVALMKNMSVLAVLIFIFAIFISHRIAGPIYRVKSIIRDIGEGKLDKRIHLRKNDELHDLADELNKMQENLKSRLKETG